MTQFELEERMKIAKKGLNRELTNFKKNEPSLFSLDELGNLMDAIHEFERKGVRTLSETDAVKINRVLNAIEKKLSVSLN